MTANIGTTERIIRIILGLAIMSLVFVGPKTPWAWLGLIFVVTGLVRWCPNWAMFGINTCAKKS